MVVVAHGQDLRDGFTPHLSQQERNGGTAAAAHAVRKTPMPGRGFTEEMACRARDL
ncbi:MAG: hypothetical protein IT438_04405 [Phycisphaerales bacterium]|nr:hypothetical protein [Phycisphaerales bacterium]